MELEKKSQFWEMLWSQGLWHLGVINLENMKYLMDFTIPYYV